MFFSRSCSGLDSELPVSRVALPRVLLEGLDSIPPSRTEACLVRGGAGRSGRCALRTPNVHDLRPVDRRFGSALDRRDTGLSQSACAQVVTGVSGGVVPTV